MGFDVNSRKMLKDGITALFSRQKIIEILTEKLLGINIQTNSKTLEEIFDNVSEKFYESSKNALSYALPLYITMFMLCGNGNAGREIKT